MSNVMSRTVYAILFYGLVSLTWSAPASRLAGADASWPQDEPQAEVDRVFLTSEVCSRCHDASPNAEALWNELGQDASPHGTWKASVMASSFIDPYWRAALERELAVAPEKERGARQELCTRCHAPMAVQEARLQGEPQLELVELFAHPQAMEGVSCTVCHRTGPDGLGTPETYGGNLPIALEARMFGPYPDPVPGPMRVHTGYEVSFGGHMVQSALCATCHTLETSHTPGAEPFLEQGPYLEWRNSVYSYEDRLTAESRSCQACHMPEQGDLVLAHNPGGRDFPFLDPRPEVRSHRIVGGNAFLLDMLAEHADELGAAAAPEDYAETARATREFLGAQSASVRVRRIEREGRLLRFEVHVQNRAGHKLPSAFPSRRAWLEIVVTGGAAGETGPSAGEERYFASGVPDAAGRILPPERALFEPHHMRLTRPDQVQIYELVAADAMGVPTTLLSAMAEPRKDNRLLPRGWRADGPHGEQTAPRGVPDGDLGDDSFAGGGDTLPVAIQLPAGAQERLRVRVRLLYQSIPPAWADAHRDLQGPASASFVSMYDGAAQRYEVLASDERSVGG